MKLFYLTLLLALTGCGAPRPTPQPTPQKTPQPATQPQNQQSSNYNQQNQSQPIVVPQQPIVQQQMCLTELQSQVSQDQIFYKVQSVLPGLYRVALQQPTNMQQSFLMQALSSDTCVNLRTRYP